MTISERYAELRREQPGLDARGALRRAKIEEEQAQFWGALRHAYDGELRLPGWRDRIETMDVEFLSTPDSRVAVILWRAYDDHGEKEHTDSSPSYHSAVEFFAGRSDFISHKESQTFYQNNRSWNLRDDFEAWRASYRKDHSRQEAEVLARAATLKLARQLDDPAQQYGYGFEVHYRDLSGAWRMHGDDSLWGCDHEDAQAATWEMGIADVLDEARELAGCHAVAQTFSLG